VGYSSRLLGLLAIEFLSGNLFKTNIYLLCRLHCEFKILIIEVCVEVGKVFSKNMSACWMWFWYPSRYSWLPLESCYFLYNILILSGSHLLTLFYTRPGLYKIKMLIVLDGNSWHSCICGKFYSESKHTLFFKTSLISYSTRDMFSFKWKQRLKQLGECLFTSS